MTPPANTTKVIHPLSGSIAEAAALPKKTNVRSKNVVLHSPLIGFASEIRNTPDILKLESAVISHRFGVQVILRWIRSVNHRDIAAMYFYFGI